MVERRGRHRSRTSDVGLAGAPEYDQGNNGYPRSSYEASNYDPRWEYRRPGPARPLYPRPQRSPSPDLLPAPSSVQRRPAAASDNGRPNSGYPRRGYEVSNYDPRWEYRRPGPAGPLYRRPQGTSRLDPLPTPSRIQKPPALSGRLQPGTAVIAFLVIVVNILALTGIRLPYIGPALGFWFLLALPAYLLYTTKAWRGSPGAERVGYSVTAVILVLMFGGLTINTILPMFGIARPLDAVPVVIFGDVLNASLYVFRRRRLAEFSLLTHIRTLRPSETRLIVTGLFSVLLAVLGANRLNNNAGDQLALLTLACVIVTIFVLLGRHRRLSDGVISVTLYCISLAILFMISLRGWYVTGHDIQSEYRVFQLTEAHGRWSMSAAHSAYNACLSITVLPTEIAHVVNVDSVYVFRFFYQLLFALCPVLAYTIWRRYASKLVALVAVIFFIGFPTYVNDVPSANRQEIAFIFLCAAALAVTNSRWPQALRRLALVAAAIGIELAHYSTMYVFIGTLVVGWILGTLVTLTHRWSRNRERAEESPWTTARRTVGIGSVLATISVMLLWGGLATQTAGPLLEVVPAAVSQFAHPSAVTPYSLFSRTALSPQRVLDNYRSAALRQNASTSGHEYFPTSTVARYATPLDNEPNMPATSFGRLLARVGVPVDALNTDARQGAAKDEQLFVVVGFAAFVISRRLRRRASHELLYIAAASIFMVAAFTVFPNLSVNYTASRAFQEALFWAAPVLAVGTVAVFRPFGRRASIRIAAGVSVAIFVSTSGFLPQILGGYGAQLNLNNGGLEYDAYYMHPQEVAAVTWLAGKPGVLPAGLQAPMGPTTSDRFAFNSPANVSGTQSVDDIYPLLIKRSSWVILSQAILRTDRAPLYADGQLITYRYPTSFLADNENLVYNNGGAEIYK